LALRRPIPDDLDFLVDLFSLPALVAHRPDPTPDSPVVCAERLRGDIAHWDRHGFGRWAVEDGDGLIGFGGLTVRGEDEAFNISYHLHPAHWGKGYATELAEEAVRAGFDDLGVARIVGLVREANPGSRRVLERAGFVFEGHVMLHGAPTQLLTLHAVGRVPPRNPPPR
jgi:[ribosomal protein S5]-alanine N-acetyltransferase